jgi:glutathione synthase/RimK-type ligase-like ATP-grasp enzyme
MSQSGAAFLGLAPFLRMSIAGADLKPVAEEMLARTKIRPDDANLWLNLATVMLCLGQREVGLAMQHHALNLQRVFHIAAAQQPARLRLMALMVGGDLAANTPLDCLVEKGDIDLDFYFVSPGEPLATPMPAHDALILAISESNDNLPLLRKLENLLSDWPHPVVNAPAHIANVGRAAASKLLQGVPGLLMPTTHCASRVELQSIASSNSKMSAVFQDCDFPVILRPLGSHGGHDLARIDGPQEIQSYLERVTEHEFYLSRFIDYAGQDGYFRKIRIALIGGKPFACHMAVSKRWMIHYVNAGMYEEAWKREEELAFMAHFDDFAQCHRVALDAIAQRTGLDYVCIDCAQTQDGELLVFEIDHAMVVHAMDMEEQFPYKQIHMQKVKTALREYLINLIAPVAQHDCVTGGAA